MFDTAPPPGVGDDRRGASGSDHGSVLTVAGAGATRWPAAADRRVNAIEGEAAWHPDARWTPTRRNDPRGGSRGAKLSITTLEQADAAVPT